MFARFRMYSPFSPNWTSLNVPERAYWSLRITSQHVFLLSHLAAKLYVHFFRETVFGRSFSFVFSVLCKTNEPQCTRASVLVTEGDVTACIFVTTPCSKALRLFFLRDNARSLVFILILRTLQNERTSMYSSAMSLEWRHSTSFCYATLLQGLPFIFLESEIGQLVT